MKLSQVTYSATINLGNFEFKRVDLKYDLNDEDTVAMAREDAMKHFNDDAEFHKVTKSIFSKKGEPCNSK